MQKTKPCDSLLLNLLFLVVEIPPKVDEELIILREVMIRSEHHLELPRLSERSVNYAFHSVLRHNLQSYKLHGIHGKIVPAGRFHPSPAS